MDNGKRKSLTLPYMPKEKELTIILASAYSGEKKEKVKYTSLCSAYEDYKIIKATKEHKPLSESTIRGYSSILKNLPKEVQERNIYDFDKDYVQTVIDNYAEDHSAKSTKNCFGFLSVVIKSKRKATYLSEIYLPPIEEKDSYTPSDDDIDRILEDAKGGQFEIALRLACYGLRRGEVLALDIVDLDENNLVTINKDMVLNENGEWVIKPRPKTKDSNRKVLIDDDLAELIRNTGYIYKGCPESIAQHLRRTQDKLNIPHFPLHALRHYFASKSHKMGMTDAEILKMGGWSKTHTFKSKYRHAFDDDVIEEQKRYAEMMTNRKKAI